MTSGPLPTLDAYWYTAACEPLGIKLRTPDPARLKSLLYSARNKLADPDLSALRILTSPSSPKDELWIINPAPTNT